MRRIRLRFTVVFDKEEKKKGQQENDAQKHRSQ